MSLKYDLTVVHFVFRCADFFLIGSLFLSVFQSQNCVFRPEERRSRMHEYFQCTLTTLLHTNDIGNRESLA